MESSQIESKQTSFRDSNMELLRIVCMLLVILCHANYMSLGSPSQSDTIIHSGSSFFRMYLFAVSAICVNCFILISGWYGIRPKLKRFISLMFQVLFVCSVSLLLYSIHSNHPLDQRDFKSLLLLTDDLWFVKTYIILYLLSPALNSFGQHVTHRQYLLILAGLFLFQTIYGWMSSGANWIDGGYSPFSFIFLYLVAQYIRLYPNRLTNQCAIHYISAFLILTFATTSVNYLSIRCGIGEGTAWFSYISPFILLESILFFLFFTKLSFKSRVVNWISSSCFAVYLFHCTPITLDGFCEQIRKYDGVGDYLSIVVMIIVIFTVSIMVDKVRMLLWSLFLKVKKIIYK